MGSAGTSSARGGVRGGGGSGSSWNVPRWKPGSVASPHRGWRGRDARAKDGRAARSRAGRDPRTSSRGCARCALPQPLEGGACLVRNEVERPASEALRERGATSTRGASRASATGLVGWVVAKLAPAMSSNARRGTSWAATRRRAGCSRGAAPLSQQARAPQKQPLRAARSRGVEPLAGRLFQRWTRSSRLGCSMSYMCTHWHTCELAPARCEACGSCAQRHCDGPLTGHFVTQRCCS